MAGDRTLIKVLDLRKKSEDEALKKWSDSQQQVSVFTSQLEKLQSFRDLYVQEMQQHQGHNMDMQQYLAYQGFIDRLDKTYERQQLMLTKLKEQTAALKDAYLKSRQDRRIIESLIEKHKQTALKAEERAEAKFADELVSSKQARILIEHNLQKLNHGK